jgi:hypothetical protein
MPDDASAPPELPDYVLRFMSPGAPLLRVTGDLERWGTLFCQVLQSKGAAAAEQVLGGLVDWMGNDLMDGWLHLPIPLFQEVSDLSEEVFRACESYLAWASQGSTPASEEERQLHEERLHAVVERVRALAARGDGRTGAEGARS